MSMSGQPEWRRARASRFRPDGVIGTPFHGRTAQRSGTPWYFNWDLHHVVDVYDDFHAELQAVRTNVAMGDMSPLCKILIEGPDAGRLVDRLITRRAEELEAGGVFYTPWCSHDGKVVSDGLVFRTGESSYLFTGDPSGEWFRQNAEGFDAAVTDRTEDFGILAVQGPRSRQVMEAATGVDGFSLGFSRLGRFEIGGVEVDAARQGFTGEHGYEVLTPAGAGDLIWDAVAEAGEPFGIRPCGEWAIDVARVEAGLLIPGPDYANAGPDVSGSHTVSASDPDFRSSPFELGMGRFVDLSKEAFAGREALASEQEAGGPPRTLAGLDIDWRAVVEAHLERGVAPNVSPRVEWAAKPVRAGGRPAGRASSITWGPTAGKLIGFGHLLRHLGEPGSRVEVVWEIPGTGDSIETPAEVTGLPFIELSRV